MNTNNRPLEKHISLIGIPSDIQSTLTKKLITAEPVQCFNSIELLRAAIDSGYSPNVFFISLDVPNSNEILSGCEQISQQSSVKFIPIIAITEEVTMEKKLKNYVLGADEVISCSTSATEIATLLDRCLQNLKTLNSLGERAEMASKTAFEAMTQNSELGAILTFLNQSTDINSFSKLAEKFFGITQHYRVNACLRVVTKHSGILYFDQIEKQSMEAKLLDAAYQKGRVIGTQRRVFFNSGPLTMLVKNMPCDEPNRNGRMRDNLLVLLNSADSIAQKIEILLENETTRKSASRETLSSCKEEMQYIKKDISCLATGFDEVFNNINMKFEEALISLGLTENQEQFIQSLLNEGYQSINALKEVEQDISRSFDHITEKIKKII